MRGKRFEATGLVAGILLPMGLICLFAFCTLALALLGGGAYRNIQQGVTDEYTNVIASNYLRTKISQNNQAGAVQLRSENGLDVLVVRSSEVAEYETRIFVYENQLRESYVHQEREFSAQGGTVITAVAACEFSISADGLFEAAILNDAGEETRVSMALLKGGEA